MRQLRLWLDEPSGFHVVLEISHGNRYAHLLHVPTLGHIEMPLDELARQERAGLATEVPVSRGLIGRIESRKRDADRYGGVRYSETFIKDALAAIRAARAE